MDDADPTTPSYLQTESHNTALCILPPRETWNSIDRLRAVNDKAFGRWPPHINLVYPFVPVSHLETAAELLSKLDYSGTAPVHVSLSEVDTFVHSSHNGTVHIRPESNGKEVKLEHLNSLINDALGRTGRRVYRPHLTLAQSPGSSPAGHDFLLEKARLLTTLTWEASEITILARESLGTGEGATHFMKLWGTINMNTGIITRHNNHPGFYQTELKQREMPRGFLVRPQTAFCYSAASKLWEEVDPSQKPSTEDLPQPVERLVVASYNVLAEFEWPPASTRYPHLVQNICSNRALADILVLQEVTDSFLEHLLTDKTICERYPFATYGTPGNARMGPLPNLLNVVVLSKFPMQWEYLEHSRKHKGSAIISFPTLRVPQAESDEALPLILAACHLSQGLTDGGVAAKKQEVHDILKQLQEAYDGHTWILAGDLNLTTSTFSISMARKKGVLSSQALQLLRDINGLLFDNGLRDVWLDTRLEAGESSALRSFPERLGQLHEGEQGATFDPQVNTLAAKQTGFGLNTRPQRYDRLFVNESSSLRPVAFNMFGLGTAKASGNEIPQHASDHWGIRCLLQVSGSTATLGSNAAVAQVANLHRASESLGGLEDLTTCLSNRGLIPTPDHEAARSEAITLLRRVLIDELISTSGLDSSPKPLLVLMPVGSTALGVWTPSSDVDCLCIGGMSSRTFFMLAVKRLRKAAFEGISILRKVRANSGTMLELVVQGIRFDLQYCPAISIAEQYPDVFNRPSTDEVFSLPMQTLLKLKPARDLTYMRRSIPDMAQYRAAHLLIKTWAISRGLYAAKFGFLGGIHISVMLVPICKSLAGAGHIPTVSDILTTFFHHYAAFDWDKQMVFDPFFHKRTKYHRSFREPLCLLGWHAPSLNTAATASLPTLRILVAELRRADQLLREEGQTWNSFLGNGLGEIDFLSRYPLYVQIDVHYWGSSPSKGRRLLGWVASRCTMLLVDLDRRAPTLLPRIWPERFVNKRDSEEKSAATECQSCYLIGLERRESPNANPSDHPSATESMLLGVLHDFEAKLKADETYYDPQSSWISLSLQRSKNLGTLEADKEVWEPHSPGQQAWDDDLDSEDEGSSDEQDIPEYEEQSTPTRPGTREKTNVASGSSMSKAVKTSFIGLGKFRTATDVLNRLRWDPTMDSSGFIVGYEDRFAGAQEKALDKWKSDLTHEEFIPQHRILYFKRRSDGIKVWERSTRIDRIFGSGVRS